MRGGDLTAVLTPEAEGQVGDVTDTKDQPRVGKLRTPANGDVADAPTQRRVTEGSAGGLGRDVEEFIRSELQRLEDNLQTGLGHLGALQQQLGAVPDGVSEHVRQHVGVLARRIEELQRSVGEITDNLYQFVADFQGPIAEKLDAASEAVAAVLQKFDAHTQQSAMQHNSLGKRLSGLGVNLEELNKITSRLHAAFDPVVELQKRRLDEMNEARNKELRQLNDARDEELKHSNRERHDELMKMHDELFKTNEAIKATHAAGMEELRGEFAELRSSYDAFRESLLANTAKLDEFSNRHLSDEVLARLAAHVLQVVANPQRLRALFYESLALPSRQTPEDIRPKS
jgi:chromosome segregation ATPase